jgi:cyclophilin family peptidyl-prolyl cis-trans isomerase
MALSQAQMICHKARMIRKLTLLACVASIAALPVAAAEEPAKPEYPSPPEIVAKATAEEWLAIAPSDLLVMDLAPDAKGKTRRVVIQLMPAPFSQGWVGNIRKLATAKFWDGTSVNRVQDNYVVQWGDATEKKALLRSWPWCRRVSIVRRARRETSIHSCPRSIEDSPSTQRSFQKAVMLLRLICLGLSGNHSRQILTQRPISLRKAGRLHLT